ncbi:centrosomal protein of 89 kDa isoform X4 [Narcine bancroftii]|uniref:centrosomal protein of 89 kDa isoform X4 n=1 Tax=Narcine bancroftii TaxID=1343680 RepID=UPI003831ACDD
MPFTFRRKDRASFKHIAHGLVPAATIAPRAAVPRTPPPRSPASSPERPRSAIAAVILTSCLTGRTVAIPQPHLALPRQRSYSESDSTRSENRSFLEPYASIDNLGFRNEWQSPIRGRPPLPLPSKSDEEYHEEEEEEEDDSLDLEQLSNKSDQPHYYVLEKEGEIHNKELMYAVPRKEKQDEIPISMSSEMTDISSDDVTSVTQIHESKSEQVQEYSPVHESKGQQLIENQHMVPEFSQITGSKSSHSVEDLRTSSQIKKKSKNVSEMSKSDLTDGGSGELLDVRMKLFKEVTERNQILVSENRVITQQAHNLTQQLQAMQLKVEQLEKENQKQQESENNQPKKDEKPELLSLRQHAQELVDENHALKMTIHRLSIELSHYQNKYRSVDKKVDIKGSHRTSLPILGPPPPWLVDMKYLSPLMLAYEDRLREKDAILQVHEKEMKNFRARVEEVVKENKQLHQQCEKSGTVSNTEWRQLQDQAKLVLEENQILMEQLEVQQAKGKGSHNRHMQEVSKLTKQIILLEAEKQNQQKELQEAHHQLNDLSSKYGQVKRSLHNKMEVDEHTTMLNDLKSKLHLEQEKQQVEVEELMGKIGCLQTEKKRMLVERTELIADNKTLEAELHTAQKSNRMAQKKIGLLKQQLEEAIEKEVAAHQYLANLISLAEKTAHERDQLVHMTKSLTNEKNGVLNKILAGNVHLGKMEEQIKAYQTKAAVKLRDINNRMKEQEEDFARRTAQHQREIRHLQQLLKDKQETLDGVLEQKRVWRIETNTKRH